MPQVSVIIPTYNAANTVIDAVNSALNQEGVEVEVFVIDDGSEDQTCELLRQFGSRISLIRQDHQGRSVARNVGLFAANFAHVAFLDADDTWLARKLCDQARYLAECGDAVLTYGQAIVMNANGVPLTPAMQVGDGKPGLHEMGEELLYGNPIPLLTVVARTDRVKDVGGFDPSLSGIEDWDLWLRLARKGAFHFSDVGLAYYRTYGFARLSTLESAEDFVEQCISMITKYCSSRAQKEKACMSIYAKGAIQSSFLGNSSFAMKYIAALSKVPEVTRRVLMTEIEDLSMFLSAVEVQQVRRQVEHLLLKMGSPSA